MATIKDVAKKAGVSVAVVSKAFNNYKDISPETRKRILEIAKELNYSPNRIARKLSSKKHSAISLISSGFAENDKKDNNSFELFIGVYIGSKEKNLDFSIYFTDSSKQHEISFVQYCRQHNIGGTILQGIRLDDPYFKELVDAKTPCVLIDVAMEEKNPLVGLVTIDNFKATKEITNYLLDLGHDDFIIVAGRKEAYVNEQRLLGVKSALNEVGITLDDTKIIYADFSDQLAYEKVSVYLNKHRPSAFICFSDLMAYGAIRAIQDFGLSVPEDISVTGFDDSMISSMSQPTITTIEQNFFEMGRQAAHLLNKLMNNETEENEVYLGYKLLERESVTSKNRHI